MNDYFSFFNHIPGNLEQSNYRIFEPDSKAEILNWFRRDDIPNARKDDFIKALINFDDNCGNFYRYRAYFLAAEALNYFPSCFADVIVNQLLNWSYVYFDWQIVPKPLRQAAREALKVTDKQRVIAAFTNLLHTTTSRVTLLKAAAELAKLDAGNKTAIAALILLLDVSKDEHIQQKIIYSLANIGYGNENAIQALISFLTMAPEYEEESISPCQSFSYSYHLVELSDTLVYTLQPQHLPQVVTSIKSHLNTSSYYSTSYRYEAVYNLIWYCAQNMSYPDFCNIWQH